VSDIGAVQTTEGYRDKFVVVENYCSDSIFGTGKARAESFTQTSKREI